jgi:hypothetical protein
MRAGRVNSGHASKFNRAGLFARAPKHIFVSGAGALSQSRAAQNAATTSGRSGRDGSDHKSACTRTGARIRTAKSRVELSFSAGVLVAVKIEEEATMGRGLLLWLIGIPIPIILLIWLFGGLHG